MSRMAHAALVIGLIAAVALMFVAIPVASATSVPAPPTPPSGSVSWAYGETEVWSCNTLTCLGENTSEFDNYTVTMSSHVYLGIDVIYIQTNTSTGTSLEVYAAEIGSAFFNMQISESDAGTTESATVNATALGYAVEIGYANVTLGNTTLTNGTTIQALALQNAASNEIANFTGSYSVSASESTESYSLDAYASAQGQEQSNINFASPLGLWPVSPSPGMNWTSNTTYSGSGSASGSLHEYYELPEDLVNETGTNCPSPYTTSGSDCVLAETNSSTEPFASSGAVDLTGADLGEFNVTLANGQSIEGQILDIATTGTYGFTQGVILVPNDDIDLDGDLGGANSALATPMVAMHHLTTYGIESGSDNAVYHPDVSGKNGISVMCTNVGTLPGKSSNSGYSTPITVSTAQSQVNNNIQMLTPSSSSSSGFPILYLVVVVVVAVVVVVGVVAYMGRKRRRTPAATAPPQGMMGQPQQAPPPGYAPSAVPPQAPQQYPPYQPQPGYPPSQYPPQAPPSQ